MLKKLTTIFCKAIVLSIFLVFVGCENLFNQNLIESQSTVSGERKDHLIELALTGNWKSSETEVENAILAILEKEGRSAETSSVKMSKIDEASIVVPAKLNPSRSAIVEEWNSITDEDIYVYKDRSAYKDIANSGNYTYSAWKKITVIQNVFYL